ncbi:serine protease inhibitor Kazal-type 14 [Sus scrofa]|uniref:Serine peptidase inhibitor Kazal type 14 (putative) n=4 Tax=Sus scrofa TaxID=9823 RepID=A0A8D0SH79_PIG|nr:serine protease inhibitor Kazal-type 14 [Sus scrofa]
MAKSFPILRSLTFFNLILPMLPSVSAPKHLWPKDENIKLNCPYSKVDLSWLNDTVNPCPGLYQPICGNNLVTYDNPCILCIESLKTQGKIMFLRDGVC